MFVLSRSQAITLVDHRSFIKEISALQLSQHYVEFINPSLSSSFF